MASTKSSKRKRVAPVDEKEQESAFIVGDGAKVAENDTNADTDGLLSKLEPGDHIAATRKDGLYEHHGIYEGVSKGYPSVIHFQGPIKSLVKGSAFSASCEKCGYRHPKDGGVVFTCLDCFSLGQNTYKLQYKLQPDSLTKRDPYWNHLRSGNVIKGYRKRKYYLEHYKEDQLYGHSRVRWKWRSKYKLDNRARLYNLPASHISGEQVVEAAQNAVPGPYDLGCNNCEHFAVSCKTGSGKSVQVNNFPIPIACRNGKRACPFSSGGTPNKRKKRNPEEAREVKDEEEKELLGSSENGKRRRTSKFSQIARTLFPTCG